MNDDGNVTIDLRPRGRMTCARLALLRAALKHLKNLHLLLSVHEDASEHSERQRDAVYGRELLGLSIEVPWSAWEGFEAGTGFETGMVFEYYAQVPGRFVVRFLPDSDCEDIGMSWAELLGEQCCLASTSEKAVLLHTRCSRSFSLCSPVANLLRTQCGISGRQHGFAQMACNTTTYPWIVRSHCM